MPEVGTTALQYFDEWAMNVQSSTQKHKPEQLS